MHTTCRKHDYDMHSTAYLHVQYTYFIHVNIIPFKCFINWREGGETENKLEKDMVNLII